MEMGDNPKYIIFLCLREIMTFKKEYRAAFSSLSKPLIIPLHINVKFEKKDMLIRNSTRRLYRIQTFIFCRSLKNYLKEKN